MQLFRKPWIWVSRFRKRKGYGVHSPFAFSFIRSVVLETTPYYAYEELAALHPWWVRWFHLYPMECRQLLFRLANFAEPKQVALLTQDEVTKKYVTAAVPKAKITPVASVAPVAPEIADFVFVERSRLQEAEEIAAAMPEGGMLVCEGIHEDRTALESWHRIQQAPHTGVTFDLYTYGVAFFNPALYKQHYKVNF